MLEPQSTRHKILENLNPDEEVHWLGTPDPRKSAFFVAKFALLGIAIFVGLPRLLSDLPFSLWPMDFGGFLLILCVCFILLLSVLPFWAFYVAQRTVLAITDKRFMVVRQFRSETRVQSYPLDSIESVEYEETDDEAGNLAIKIKGDKAPRHRFFGVQRVRRADKAILAGIQKRA